MRQRCGCGLDRGGRGTGGLRFTQGLPMEKPDLGWEGRAAFVCLCVSERERALLAGQDSGPMPCIHGRPSVRQREGKVKDFVLIYGQRGRRRLCARPLVSRVVATRTIRSRTCFVLIHVQHARTMRMRLFSGFVVQQQITQAPSDGCTAQTGGGDGTTGAWIVSSAQRARAMRRLRDGPGEGFKIVPRASNVLVLCSKTTRTALERALSWHKTGVQTSDGRWLGWPPGGALQARGRLESKPGFARQGSDAGTRSLQGRVAG